MKETQTADIKQLWESFLQNRDAKSKNEILTHYLYLVVGIVKRVMPQYRGYCDMNDLIGEGVLGLIDALDKYDPAMNTKFQTYAAIRIKGAVLDHLRRQDWASTTLRKKLNGIQRALDELELEIGRPPTEAEIAERMGMDEREVIEALQTSQVFNTISFESLLYERERESVSAGLHPNPGADLERQEMLEALRKLIGDLPEKERMVIVLHYYEGMTMGNIAKILGVSESRVSQIHSKVLLKMRRSLEE